MQHALKTNVVRLIIFFPGESQRNQLNVACEIVAGHTVCISGWIPLDPNVGPKKPKNPRIASAHFSHGREFLRKSPNCMSSPDPSIRRGTLRVSQHECHSCQVLPRMSKNAQCLMLSRKTRKMWRWRMVTGGGKHFFFLVWSLVQCASDSNTPSKIENHQPFAVRIYQEKPIAGKGDHDEFFTIAMVLTMIPLKWTSQDVRDCTFQKLAQFPNNVRWRLLHAPLIVFNYKCSYKHHKYCMWPRNLKWSLPASNFRSTFDITALGSALGRLYRLYWQQGTSEKLRALREVEDFWGHAESGILILQSFYRFLAWFHHETYWKILDKKKLRKNHPIFLRCPHTSQGHATHMIMFACTTSESYEDFLMLPSCKLLHSYLAGSDNELFAGSYLQLGSMEHRMLH